MSKFAGSTAVVTGAASGIGLALTKALLAAEARVVMADVEGAALEAAATEVAGLGTVLPAVVDVRDPDAVDALAARTAEELGVAQFVFANAGISVSGATWDMTPDDWQWILGVNVLGVAHMVRAFVPPLIASGLPGNVCFTSSVAGYLNQPGFGAYNASKHAVVGIAESLAADLREAGHPIGVTLLAPWFVRTNLAQAGRNRPSDLSAATPPTDFSKSISKRLGAWSDTTQTADQVAALALDAIEEGRFAVFPYEPSRDAVRSRIEAVLAGGIADFYLPPAPTTPLWQRGEGGPDLGPQRVIHIDDATPAVTTDGSVPKIGLRPLVSDDCDYCIMTFEFPPHYSGVVHSHPADTVYLVRRGEFIVDGEGTFLPGDLRWVKAGTTYGPERAGPDGCEVVLITKGSFPPG